jgi:hypothetical protein
MRRTQPHFTDIPVKAAYLKVNNEKKKTTHILQNKCPVIFQ